MLPLAEMSNPRCYRGHSLKCVSHNEDWVCNACGSLYNGCRFGCHEPECDYDICCNCVGYVYNVVCPNHHLLMTINYVGKWVCSNHLDGPVFENGSYLGCNQTGCDYGLCFFPECQPEQIHMPVHVRVKRRTAHARRLGTLCQHTVSVGLALVGITYTP